jgi:hypothetical protein
VGAIGLAQDDCVLRCSSDAATLFRSTIVARILDFFIPYHKHGSLDY